MIEVESYDGKIIKIRKTDILRSFSEYDETFVPEIPFSSDVLNYIKNSIIPNNKIELINLINALCFINDKTMNNKIIKHLTICPNEYYDHENESEINYMLYLACIEGNIEFVNFLIENGANNWNNGLIGACRGGHLKLVNLMIYKGASDRYGAFINACIGGNIEIIKKITDKNIKIWDWGLNYACKYGNLDVVEFMISKGVINNYSSNFFCIQNSIYYACIQHRIDIIELLLSNIPLELKNYRIWNYGLKGACKGGHLDLIKIMIKNGANWWDFGLIGACLGGHLNVAKLMISKLIKTKKIINWNDMLYYSCKGGNIDIINTVIIKGANNWNKGIEGACEGGHLDIVEYIEKKKILDEFKNEYIFNHACEIGHLNFKSAVKNNYYLRYIIWSIKYLLIDSHESILNFMLEDVIK